MALDQNDTTFASWADAEVAAGVAARTALFEKIVQDLIVAKNLYNSIVDVPWADNDIRDHFDSTAATNDRLTTGTSANGRVQHTADDHYMEVDSTAGAGEAWVVTVATRRADKVPTFGQWRVKVTSHGATNTPYIGFVSGTGAMPVANGAWFTRGTNANTWKAVTRSSGVDRTTTDNLAGNYTGWDVLAIDFGASSVKFYIAGVLVATHTVTLPTSTALFGIARGDFTAASQTVRADYFIWKQTTNPVSP